MISGQNLKEIMVRSNNILNSNETSDVDVRRLLLNVMGSNSSYYNILIPESIVAVSCRSFIYGSC